MSLKNVQNKNLICACNPLQQIFSKNNQKLHRILKTKTDIRESVIFT